MTDEQPEDRRAPEQGDFEGNREKGSAEWSRPPTPLPSLSSQTSDFSISDPFVNFGLSALRWELGREVAGQSSGSENKDGVWGGDGGWLQGRPKGDIQD